MLGLLPPSVLPLLLTVQQLVPELVVLSVLLQLSLVQQLVPEQFVLCVLLQLSLVQQPVLGLVVLSVLLQLLLVQQLVLGQFVLSVLLRLLLGLVVLVQRQHVRLPHVLRRHALVQLELVLLGLQLVEPGLWQHNLLEGGVGYMDDTNFESHSDSDNKKIRIAPYLNSCQE